MKITSKDCFSILQVINKMNIKKELIETILEIAKVETKVKKIQDTLLGIAEKEGKDIKEVVQANIELSEKYDNLGREIQAKGFELIFLFIENLPKAEKEVYTTLSKIYGVTVKEVEAWEGDKLIEAIKEIATNQAFQRFFSSLMK